MLVGGVAAAIFSGGAAIPAVVLAGLGTVGGGITVAKGVVEYEKTENEGTVHSLRFTLDENHYQIRTETRNLAKIMEEISHDWDQLKKILTQEKELSEVITSNMQ